MHQETRQPAYCNVMLDCGAYSAFTRGGKPIDLHDYSCFIKANPEYITHVIALDVIPGEPGTGNREYRAEVIDPASRVNFENFCRMRDAGLDPLPVFHQDEDFHWLDKYRDAGARYIALAPWEGGIYCGDWIGECLTVLDDTTIKIHLLGIASHPVLHHFRPTSCDASTIYHQSKAALIPVPVFRDGRWDYSLPHDIVAIGHEPRRYHYDQLDQFEQERTREYLAHCGVTLQQAQSDVYCRWRIWVYHLSAVAESASTRMYFATSVQQKMVTTLAQCGAKYHLLSYYELRKRRGNTLETYHRSFATAAETDRTYVPPFHAQSRP